MILLLNRYPRNGHTALFDPQTKNSEPCRIIKQTADSISFPKNGHTAWFDPQTKKLEAHCITKQTEPHNTILYCTVQ